MNKPAFFVIVIFFLAPGCIKDCRHNLLPESIKPFLFKQGSYWVFSNSASGGRDTFSVATYNSQIIMGISPVACKGESSSEGFEMTVVNASDTFRVVASGSSHLVMSNKSFSIQGMIFDSSISEGQCSKFSDSLCLIGVSALTVGNHAFSEVYNMHTVIVDAGGSEVCACNLFWVKNVGIVKIVRHDSISTTWDIVDWNVVQ